MMVPWLALVGAVMVAAFTAIVVFVALVDEVEVHVDPR